MNGLLGLWLVVSAAAWPHHSAQFTNTWVVGLVIAAMARLALTRPLARYVNTIAGVWLVVAAFALPRLSGGTMLNNTIVGLVVVAMSLLGPSKVPVGDRPLRTSG